MIIMVRVDQLTNQDHESRRVNRLWKSIYWSCAYKAAPQSGTLQLRPVRVGKGQAADCGRRAKDLFNKIFFYLLNSVFENMMFGMRPGPVLLLLFLLLDITDAAEGSSYLNFDIRNYFLTYRYVVFGKFLRNAYMKTICCIKNKSSCF